MLIKNTRKKNEKENQINIKEKLNTNQRKLKTKMINEFLIMNIFFSFFFHFPFLCVFSFNFPIFRFFKDVQIKAKKSN